MAKVEEKFLSEDLPVPVVPRKAFAGLDPSLASMVAIPGSRMFEIRDALAVHRRNNPGEERFDASQGDGGASLPGVPGEIWERALALQREHGSSYDKPFGTAAFREAVVERYWELEAASGWGRENVLCCQGGRDGLLKAYDAMQFLGHGRRGDFLVVSRVPWISYNWGPYAVGANVMLAPGSEADGWQLTAEGVEACVAEAAKYDGRKVSGLVVTSPDNPTGRTISLERQVELARSAFRAGIPFVLFDWIYHRVTDEEPHDLNAFLLALDPGERERVIVLDGLTKSLGASNVRNAHLLASKEFVLFMQKRASHGVIPSYFSQAVAMAAYETGYEKASAGITGPTNESRKLVTNFCQAKGLRAIVGKGYYAFIDVGPYLEGSGLKDSAELGKVLAERHGLAVVPGVYFSGFGARWIRFSYALPPETAERALDRLWTALHSL